MKKERYFIFIDYNVENWCLTIVDEKDLAKELDQAATNGHHGDEIIVVKESDILTLKTQLSKKLDD